VASWDHSFFEIADGFVSTFSIVEVTPDRKGNFAVQVPDFVNDGVTRFYQVQAEWSVTASEPETAGDHRYWLNAENQPGKSPGRLAIEREYPNEVRFAVLPFP
jgi:hypothetical protein